MRGLIGNGMQGADIDGVRAVSVVSIVLFHANCELFFAVIAATLVARSFFLLRYAYQSLAKSAFSSVLRRSSIFFWRQAAYSTGR